MNLAEHHEVDSIETAIALAEEFLARGRFDLFRGQTTDWPMRSTFVRLSPEKRREAVARHGEFAAYLARTPELRHLREDTMAMMAFAQHYEMPTVLLDFTTLPAVAGWFASHGNPPPEGRRSVIYLAHEASVARHYSESLPALRWLRIDVDNLWRLQAQAGLFLHLPYADAPELDTWLAEGFGSIRFPYRGPATSIPKSAIYPDRKSRLEILLDGFKTETKRREAHQRFRAAGVPVIAPPDSDEPRPAPAFRGGHVPDIHASWTGAAAAAWERPPVEAFRRQDHPPEIVLEADPVALRGENPNAVLEAFAAQIHAFITARAELRGSYLDFRLRLSGTDTAIERCVHPDSRLRRTVAQDLADCWDGMRRFPYTDETISRALAYLATAWCLVHGAHQSLYNALKPLLGENVLAEFGLTSGGQDAMAPVPETELIAALRPDLPALLLPDELGMAVRPKQLLHQVIEPRRLFDLNAFAPLFGTRFIPGQFLLRQRDVVLFTPLGIEKLGNR